MAELRAGQVAVPVSGVRVSSDTVTATLSGELSAARAPERPILAALADLGLEEEHALALGVRHVEAPGAERRGVRPGLAEPPMAAVGEVVVDVPPPPPGRGQVLLVEHDGAVSWSLPEPTAGTTRGRGGAAAPTRFRVPVAFVADEGPVDGRRGVLGAVTRRVLRVLTFELIDKVAGEVGDFFARRWEERQRPHRLRAFTPANYRDHRVPPLDDTALRLLSGGPALLLLHGTNSLCHSGFALFAPETVQGFHDRYEGRVFAFDHPTLSVDPFENCKALAATLPDGFALDVDVLAHSRGGLVARALAEMADDAGVARRLNVRQVVFVATPNRGTPLADLEHIGRLLDGLTNLLDFVPDNPVTDSLAGIVTVVKQLAVGAAKGLDGLVAMSPRLGDNPFLARLNTPRPHSTRYRAIAADYEPPSGSPLARITRDRLIDGIFGFEANDLIVPTASAYSWNGATGFPLTERIVLPPTSGVDHSTFWTAPEAIKALASWLSPEASALRATATRGGAAGGVAVRGDPLADVDDRLASGDVEGVRQAVRALPAEQLEQLEREVGDGALDAFLARAPTVPKAGTVVVLPGVMGSLLDAVDGADRDRIWINALRLMAGEFPRLRAGAAATTVAVGGVFRCYLPMVITLGADWDVVPVGFDWRLSLREAADLLKERIRAQAEDGPGPVHLVAHSMGGLVARMLIATDRPFWDAIDSPADRSKGGRLVMLGTPNLGSFAIALAFTGDDTLVRWLARLDVVNSRDQIRRVLLSFPGAYELLAAREATLPDSAHRDLYDPGTWQEGFIDPALLAQAAASQALLAEKGIDVDRTYYVAGTGHDTPAGVRVRARGAFSYRMTRAGDGCVTHELGFAPGQDNRSGFARGVWYSTAGHGELPSDRTVIAAVADLLREGKTARLPQAPPPAARAAPLAGARWVRAEAVEPPGDADLGAEVERSLRSPAAGRAQRRAAAQQVADLAVEKWLGSPLLAPAGLPALRAHVLHASLEFASFPVIVGHYRGDPIAGAEGYLDARLGGRLSRRQVLDRYPREIGQVLTVRTDGGRPRGALVVGLGPAGELTATGLARAVRDAAVEHALGWLEHPDPDVAVGERAIGVSTVLLGSYGPTGLPLATSVAAIVEGVILANQVLTERDLSDRVRLGAVEIVERYANPAEMAAHALRDVETQLPAALRALVAIRPEPRLRVGEGSRPAAWTADYGAGMWHRLIITAGEADREGWLRLHFTSLGSKARADQLVQPVDADLVGAMLRDAVVRPATDGLVNTALFEMLLPNDVKRELAGIDNLQIVLDEASADFPWEALSDRGGLTGASPLARRVGLLRQLRLDTRLQLDAPTGTASALVVGDPPGDPANFGRLDGARREAGRVAELLAHRMPVEAVVFGPEVQPDEGSATKVLGALYKADYQIVHIAAHGTFEPGESGAPVGGVVIGPREFLTASMIGSMRRPPDIVFLNCCHLASVGAIEIDRADEAARRAFAPREVHKLAASLSRELMRMGVKAVVAAGWSVADRPAEVFATTFYDAILAGDTFGDAVLLARDRAFEADGGASNTWAAYQCYGDPGFRLSTEGGRRRPVPPPVSADELVRRVQDIAVAAGEAAKDPPGHLLPQLEELRTVAEESWPEDALVLSALGRAYGQLARLETAIGCYRRALRCAEATLPVNAIEMLANLEHRLAMQLKRKGEREARDLDDPATERGLRRKAKERLDVLDKLGESAGRHGYRGGWYKREAVIAASQGDTAGRDAAMTSSAQEYLAAWRLSGGTEEERDPYGAFNALQLAALGAELAEEDRKELEAYLHSEVHTARAADSFWDRAAAGNRLLTCHLLDASLATAADAVVAAYQRAFGERASAVERDSVVDHVRDLAQLAPPEAGAVLARLAERL